ncbi:hypothetical protein BDZ89DRAFT_969537, partial [Hymenopellis radicata]
FSGDEFSWGDSAYAVTPRMMPIYKKPASDVYENTKYDKAISHVRMHSEHCMGALKGRWQCLRGLRVQINGDEDHVKACRWISVCIILYNLIIDIEGHDAATRLHGCAEEQEDIGDADLGDMYEDERMAEGEGEEKRQRLVQELMDHRAQLRI